MNDQLINFSENIVITNKITLSKTQVKKKLIIYLQKLIFLFSLLNCSKAN